MALLEHPQSSDTLATHASIFLRLVSPADRPREVAWRHFVDRYAPVIAGFARTLGARETSIDELVQDVLIGFFSTSPRFVYDPQRGRFRSYLRTVTVNCLRKHLRGPPGPKMLSMNDCPDDSPALAQLWEEHWKAQVLARALEELRVEMADSRTFQAFESYVMKSEPVDDVARRLEMSANSVHQAKHRISEALRTRVAKIEAEEG